MSSELEERAYAILYPDRPKRAPAPFWARATVDGRKVLFGVVFGVVFFLAIWVGVGAGVDLVVGIVKGTADWSSWWLAIPVVALGVLVLLMTLLWDRPIWDSLERRYDYSPRPGRRFLPGGIREPVLLKWLRWSAIFLTFSSVMSVGFYHLLPFTPDLLIRVFAPLQRWHPWLSNIPSPLDRLFLKRFGILAGPVLVGLGLYQYAKLRNRMERDWDEQMLVQSISAYLEPGPDSPVKKRIQQEVFGFPARTRWPESVGEFISRDLDDYDSKKDVVRGLRLLAQWSREVARDEGLGQERPSLDRLIRWLDDLIRSHLDEDIKEKYPEQVYYLRVNLIRDYLHSGKLDDSQYANPEQWSHLYDVDKDLPVFQFCNHVLGDLHGKESAESDDEAAHGHEHLLGMAALRQRFAEVFDEDCQYTRAGVKGSLLRRRLCPDGRPPRCGHDQPSRNGYDDRWGSMLRGV